MKNKQRYGKEIDKKVGRDTKIESILSTIPTYQLSYLPLPKNVNKELEGKLRNFFWIRIEDKKGKNTNQVGKDLPPKRTRGAGT